MRKLLVWAAALAVSLGATAYQASAQYMFSDEPAPSANDNYGGATYQNRRSNASPIPRQTVSYGGNHKAGTIIIKTSERRLYYTLGDGRAIKYAVGVGRQGFTWSGTNTISRKAEWPGWTPPAQMRARERAKGRILPAYQKGGPNNPLGARAMYIGSTLYRIHGTNQPSTIGQAMSSGCIRMANDDVIHLYNQVKIGSRVIVQH
ncbi:MAG: L,D-transpeptidase [Rhizobiaceae bacterium]|nr:L,D-transpeptidase [Rhizobiaceae bacterium]